MPRYFFCLGSHKFFLKASGKRIKYWKDAIPAFAKSIYIGLTQGDSESVLSTGKTHGVMRTENSLFFFAFSFLFLKKTGFKIRRDTMVLPGFLNQDYPIQGIVSPTTLHIQTKQGHKNDSNIRNQAPHPIRVLRNFLSLLTDSPHFLLHCTGNRMHTMSKIRY